MARRSERRPKIDVQSSYFLRQGLARALLVANAYRPSRNPLLLVPSFFASWITSEAAPAMLATWGLRTSRQVVLGRRRGQRLSRSDKVGLALSAGAALGSVGLIREAMRAGEQFDAALSTLVPEDELADRPSAVRLGALLPLLNGNRRRRKTRDVVFNSPANGEKPLKLDVYLPLRDPEPGEKRPAVLQIHGGAWVLGSKNEQGIPLLNHLASCGWVGFNADYRLGPRSKAPNHLIDCKRALAWIREHADEYNVDPNFVVVTGGSAGGHLCALMALTQNDPAFQPGFEDADTSVQAAVPFYGVYDLTDREGYYGESGLVSFTDLIARLVMEVGLEDGAEQWAAYSPLDRITADAPPMFVIHGDRDVLVPVAGARRFVEELKAVSKQPVVYAELEGAQHAFEIFPSFRTVETVEYVERFLHHIHSGYLASSREEAVAEPVPDDGTEEPRRATQVGADPFAT